MIFKDKYFPYPVIRSTKGDFTNTIFNISSITNNDDTYYLEIELTNVDILNLIKSEKASFVLHLEESETMYRVAHNFRTLSFKFQIPNDEVRRRVELSLFIVMDENVIDFNSQDLDIIYEGIKINYEVHNIIGYTDSQIIKINKESDEIKNVRSIFSLISSPDIKDIYELSITNSSIVIKINNKDYKSYASLVNSFKHNRKKDYIILLSILIMPTFVQVLNEIHKNVEDFKNYYWFNSLVKAYEKKEINILNKLYKEEFNSYKYAQIVFDGVISESINIMMKNNVEERR